ncbi:hypothetical protein [Chondrinema litorale]|uniref:hypothetical protein n=1 Tax=Chondrinema litorale TaxID=2994555 RepID=UPI002543D912|nr:hypothetical protein [Chondrinema litorale]UZR94853.1 hypothetical protein OQ292_03370 [Chondrinema litorale]
MLVSNKLLVDNDCPMCKAYGACFTRFNLVDNNTISPYQKTNEAFVNDIDLDRAKNEIALHDTQTHQTLYGLDALIKITTHKSQLFKAIAEFMYPFLFRLYKLISFNRKVIYPSANTAVGRDCTPDFNLKYRLVYIILVALFTGVVLHEYSVSIYSFFGWESSWFLEIVVCVGQIIWQYVAVKAFRKKNNEALEYLGNMSTVSLIGGLLLSPVLIIQSFVVLPVLVLVGYFFVVVSLMLLEHIRRCKLKKFPTLLSASWVLYRMGVLVFILTIFI